jgi:hypothetical protein
MGAGRAYSNEPNPIKWYIANKDKMILHPDTSRYVDVTIHGEKYYEMKCLCGLGNDAPYHPMECRDFKEYEDD